MSVVSLTKTIKLFAIFVVVFLLILIFPNVIHAQAPGDLDTTFNNTGVLTFTTGLFADGGYGIALQKDGKIVTTGCSFNFDSDCDVTVVRFNNDGSLDTDFNGTGVVTTSTAIGIDGGTSVAIQPNNGKIVIAGEGIDAQGVYTTPPFPHNKIVLARYETDGSLDLSLKGTGFLTTSVSNWDDRSRAVAIQPDGKIVVAGEGSRNYSHTDIAVIRYNGDGNLDTSFSDDGIVTTSIGDSSTAASVALQPDGKIVMAGWYDDGGNRYFVVARYTVTGTLDTQFNSTGLVTGTIQGEAHAVTVQLDNKIVVAGGGDDFIVARYLTNGNWDAGFGAAGTGIVTTSISSASDGATAIAIQDDGKIVAAGYSNQTVSSSDFTVVRYTSSGNLDTSFNRTGIVTTPIANSLVNAAMSVVIQPDGNIVAAGSTLTRRPVYYSQDFVVVRYIGEFAFSTYVPVILKKD
jgi:uncharacterized delta-60 repeat protein